MPGVDELNALSFCCLNGSSHHLQDNLQTAWRGVRNILGPAPAHLSGLQLPSCTAATKTSSLPRVLWINRLILAPLPILLLCLTISCCTSGFSWSDTSSRKPSLIIPTPSRVRVWIPQFLDYFSNSTDSLPTLWTVTFLGQGPCLTH